MLQSVIQNRIELLVQNVVISVNEQTNDLGAVLNNQNILVALNAVECRYTVVGGTLLVVNAYKCGNCIVIECGYGNVIGLTVSLLIALEYIALLGNTVPSSQDLALSVVVLNPSCSSRYGALRVAVGVNRDIAIIVDIVGSNVEGNQSALLQSGGGALDQHCQPCRRCQQQTQCSRCRRS